MIGQKSKRILNAKREPKRKQIGIKKSVVPAAGVEPATSGYLPTLFHSKAQSVP